MKELRATAYVVGLSLLVLLAGLFWWLTMTAPMMAADGPAIISVFLTVVAYLLWRQRRKYV